MLGLGSGFSLALLGVGPTLVLAGGATLGRGGKTDARGAVLALGAWLAPVVGLFGGSRDDLAPNWTA